ncbi:hypothetical protein SAMN02745172_01126 [Pseudoxanthobacter soli DSM 19599]|uniref:Uncharacterized protein n=1 Tax=Pseudoxanthobacter soli DSM 19599 TaxID=1123029 RepID=A0A1M7ZCV9_9HYPH|nr:hypothetical protein [Pseudoxanthobacter soli]SHO62672.1 hypothetical protein SAMN02745172_01126 [Pseudoxanthobacter soli DSM 19599]
MGCLRAASADRPVSATSVGLWLVLFVSSVLAVMVVAGLLTMIPDAWFVENGPIEDAQVVLLVAAAAIFVVGAVVSQRPEIRLVAFGFALLSLAMADRELDLGLTKAPAWLTFAINGWAPHLLLGLAMLIVLAIYRHAFFDAVIAGLRMIASPVGICLIIAFVFALAGWPFDKGYFRITHAAADRWEESTEFVSYAWMVAAAIAFRPR